MQEIERTFLAKSIPDNLKECRSKEIMDIYLPKDGFHPSLRIRKNGLSFEITKKQPIHGKDSSVQTEITISLTEEEFESFVNVEGKRVRKIRYYLDVGRMVAEVDVFQDDLKGLILVDFEFNSEKEKDNFDMPDFCLSEVTQEKFLAGGMLCGKSYKDIENDLKKFNYRKIMWDGDSSVEI